MARIRGASSQTSHDLSFKSSAAAQADFWFDASLLYVRVTNCQLKGDWKLPDILNVHFPPREIAISMEVNGGRIPPSEQVSIVLRRNRIESETTDAYMYVSTDNFRTSSTIHFQILEQGTLLVSGTLEKLAYSPRPAAARPAVPTRNDQGWVMATTCEIGPLGCAFVKAKYELFKHGLCISFPNIDTGMEICVVGRYRSEPVILTQNLLLTAKRRSASLSTLNAIPEDNEVDKEGCQIDATSMVSDDFLDEAGESFFNMSRGHAESPKEMAAEDYYSKVLTNDSSLYLSDVVDQEETWYNKGISRGIKLGLGIGIGMCIGLGIGLGLIIRKFRVTTKELYRITV